MKVRSHHDGRMILSGPPGGVGTVALLFAVGIAMSAGGVLFCWAAWDEGLSGPLVMGGLCGLIGVAIFLGGAGAALTRDRLELDEFGRTGRWTRRLLGRPIKAPIDFAFDHAKHVTVEEFTESAPDQDRAAETAVRKVRARLLVAKPRRAIVLDEAELQRVGRVRSVAQAVADVLGRELEDATIETTATS